MKKNDLCEAKRQRTFQKMRPANNPVAITSAALSYASIYGATDPVFRSSIFAVGKQAQAFRGKEGRRKGGQNSHRSPGIVHAIQDALENTKSLHGSPYNNVLAYLKRYTRDAPLEVSGFDDDYIVFVEDDRLRRLLADGSYPKDGGQDVTLGTVKNIVSQLGKT